MARAFPGRHHGLVKQLFSTMALVVSAATFLIGCGSGEGTKTDESTLQSLVVTKSDLPPWYNEEAGDAAPDEPGEDVEAQAFNDRMLACVGLPSSTSYTTGEVSGPMFLFEQKVSSQARSVTSAELLQREYLAYANKSS